MQWLQEYAAIGGNPRFCELSAKLAFGENSSVLREKRNCTVQALSGTGSLRVCCASSDFEHFMNAYVLRTIDIVVDVDWSVLRGLMSPLQWHIQLQTRNKTRSIMYVRRWVRSSWRATIQVPN